MTKRTLNASRIVLSVLLVVSLLASLCVSLAFAEDDVAAQTREFDAATDRMLDNLTSDGARAAYRSVSWTAGQCDDIEDPILKMASPKISAGFEVLSMKLRSPDGSIKLADLKLIVRVSDELQLAPVALTDASIADGVELSGGSDIGADWADLTIDFAQTELKVNGAALNTKTPDAMVGFHLVSDAAKGGKLDIAKVSVVTGATETTIVDFDAVNEAWWFGGEAGTFTDMPRCYEITDAKEIKSTEATANNVDEAYEAIVLGIAGSGNVTVAPIGEDGTVGTAKAWTELTDLNGTAVTALDGTFRNAVISLASLGAKKIQGVKVAVTGGTVLVSKAFFSNVVTEEPDKAFPVLDASTIGYLSQFNFEYTTAGADYNKAVEDCAGFNLDYILSYSNKNNVITDGHLVLDAQGEAFTSIKIRSKVASAGRNYLVVKYALKDGATLNDFRFSVIDTANDTASKIMYANQMLAGKMLPSLSDINPYGDGEYKYLVIDLVRTFGTKYISGVDMYISGTGKVLIDEIFYASAYEKLAYTDEILSAPIEKTADAEGYGYVGGFDVPAGNYDYMLVETEGDVSGARIEFSGVGTYWFVENAQGTLLDRDGVALDVTAGKFVIDLAKSGVDKTFTAAHIHNTFAAAGDTLTIKSVKFASRQVDIKWSDEALASDFAGKDVTATATGYAYVGYANGKGIADGAKYMSLDIEGDVTQLRIGMAGKTVWFAENAEGTFVGLDGNKFATLTGKQTYVIDLEKSGVTDAIGDMHFHYTFDNVGDNIKITSLKFGKDNVPSATLPRNDDTKPVLTASVSVDNVITGNEVTISATATDNYSTSDKITIAYSVTVNGKQITVSGNKFTATEAGTYTVKVVATDEAGNMTEKVFTVVATAPSTPHECGHKCEECGKCTSDCTDPACEDKCQGHKKGCFGVVATSSIALLAVLAGAAVVVTKRKK